MNWYRIFALIALNSFVTVLGTVHAMNSMHDLAYEDGKKVGKKLALDTRRPSDELELACAALWVGEQNRIAAEREKIHGR